MSQRHRLGVALLLGPPVAEEVDGLRKALGDSSLGSVAPHLTLVPPVNVRATEVPSVLEALRDAAHRQPRPIELLLGPVATFSPASPVLYLAVRGASEADSRGLERLHQAVRAGPLLRPERWPWVPHVTVCDDVAPDRIGPALQALGFYSAPMTVERVVILEQREHRWLQFADAEFGPPAVVGRGGLDLEITAGRVPGPDAVALAEAEGLLAEAVIAQALTAREAFVLTGLRGGKVAAVAAAWAPSQPGAPVHACVLVEPSSRRLGLGRAMLLALESRASAEGWAHEGVRGHGPQGFFASSSAWARGSGPPVPGPPEPEP